jgi:glycosyltransferase involved in cell wall biosynthesis
VKILVLAHGLSIGGTEVVVTNLTRWLRGHGVDVEVGCLDEVGELGEKLRLEGVPVVCYGRKSGKDLGLPLRIARHLRRGRIDLIHAHQMTPFVYGVLAKRITGVPLILTEHGRFHPDVATTARRLFNRLFRSSADRVTAVSAAVRESLVSVEGFRREAIEVLYNAVDIERFAPSASRKEEARRRLRLPLDARVIGSVGRLHPDKNHALLLRVAARLRSEIPALFVVIVGSGDEQPRLVALARDLGVSDRVILCGERKDVEAILPAFDVFALPSRTEGTPMTLLEAMAAEVPIVASAVGGIPEILERDLEAILVTRSTDEREFETRFTGALHGILVNGDLVASLTGRAARRVRRDFAFDSIFGRYRALYHALLPNCGDGG